MVFKDSKISPNDKKSVHKRILLGLDYGPSRNIKLFVVTCDKTLKGLFTNCIRQAQHLLSDLVTINMHQKKTPHILTLKRK